MEATLNEWNSRQAGFTRESRRDEESTDARGKRERDEATPAVGGEHPHGVAKGRMEND